MTARKSILRNTAYDDLFRWILIMALICLGAVILWDYSFLHYLFQNDISRVSTLIIIIFGFASFFCLWVLIDYCGELHVLESISSSGSAAGLEQRGKNRILGVADDLWQFKTTNSGGAPDVLLEAIASEFRAPVRQGVFISDLLYKLGLLGTVIGFILMLTSMRDLGEFDVEIMREALQTMTRGMAVSLLTTITGLTCGMLLRLQFNVLDGLVLKTMQKLVRYSEVELTAEITRNHRTDV